MSTAGYSGTPLPKKLGIGPGSRVALVGAPDGFRDTLAPLPVGVEFVTARAQHLDVIVFFVVRAAELRRRFLPLAMRLQPAGGLWVGWPKKASGVATDVGFDVVQATGLAAGLVDNKVAALDETWSGLRFVVRRENREAWPLRRG